MPFIAFSNALPFIGRIVILCKDCTVMNLTYYELEMDRSVRVKWIISLVIY